MGGTLLYSNLLRNISKTLLYLPLLVGVCATSQQKPPTPAPIKAAVAPSPSASYLWKMGTTYRYRVVGFFNGHIPPFASPGSPPIHIRVELEYSALPKKQTDKGTEVAFSVDKADLYLLEKEPDATGKLPKGAEEALFPIPLEQVKEALDATATLSPSGSVVSVSGGDNNSVKVNFGIELRKLFLLLLPVTFGEKGEPLTKDWTYEDGILGKNPGKILYSAHTSLLTPTSATVALTANSDIDEKKNKDDRPAKDANDTYRTLVGKAGVTGTVRFVGATIGGRLAGRVSSATLLLKVDILQKRIKPDPEKPEEPAEQRIDVQARLNVQEIRPDPKAATPKPVAPKETKKTP